MDRNELQETAAKYLFNKKRLVCMWATGTGKSNVVLRFLKEHPMDTLILVPEQNNIENWREEFRKFGVDDSRVSVICYASLHKFTRTNWGLLVLDEVPHMDTQKRIAMLRSVCGEYILALGAVVDEDERNSLELVYGKFPFWHISLKRAIDMGILSKPRVYVIHMELDDADKKYWHKGRLYTAKGKYDYLNRTVDSAVNAFANSATKGNKFWMQRAGNERKRFLGELKEEALKRICDGLEKMGKRFLCFCSSVKQAERIGGEKAFTSKSPKSFDHLNKFNNHEINSLYVVGKLIEGQNLKDIDCGVIGQLGGTQRITVQEIGRILRSDNPMIYTLVFDDTKDNSFLYTLTSSIPEEYISHLNF